MNNNLELLFNAIESNDVQAVKKYIDKPNFNINDVNSIGASALNVAVGHNNRDMVKYLVENGASLNNRSSVISPLLLAISAQFEEMAELLVDLGANVNEGWLKGEPINPLRKAASCLDYKITKMLLCKGAKVNIIEPKMGRTLLHEVALFVKGPDERSNAKVRFKIAKLLLQYNMDLSVKCVKQNLTPLEYTLSRPSSVCNVDLVKLFIKEGAAVRKHSDSGVLIDYCINLLRFNSPEIVRLCLERGSDYTLPFKTSANSFLNPYHLALKQSSPEVVKVFWEFGCPVDLTPAQAALNKGSSASLTMSVTPNNLDLLRIQTKFIEGVQQNNFIMVLEAIKKGAVPKGVSERTPSPLHFLARNEGNHKIARVLLENGAPVNKLDISVNQVTCLNFALFSENFDIMKEILMFGGCFNKNDMKTVQHSKNKSKFGVFQAVIKAFHYTREGSHKVLKRIKQYLDCGDKDMARVLMNCVDWRGRTLLSVALSNGHIKLAEELMKLRIQHF